MTMGRSRRASVASVAIASTEYFSPAGRGDVGPELLVTVDQTVTVGVATGVAWCPQYEL